MNDVASQTDVIHSDKLKPYRSKALGGNFLDMEDKFPDINSKPYDQPPLEPPIQPPTDDCVGHAVIKAVAEPTTVYCAEANAELKAEGNDRDGKPLSVYTWDFAFPFMEHLGVIGGNVQEGFYYEPPTCAELFADSGCFDGSETLKLLAVLCDGTVHFSTVIITIKDRPPLPFVVSGPDEDVTVGSVFSTNTSDAVVWSITSGAINESTGVITAQTCGTATVTATSACGEHTDSMVIRWLDDPGSYDSRWTLITDCDTCPPSGSSSGICCNRGEVISGEWKSQIEDRGCSNVTGCSCLDSVSGHPCDQCPDGPLCGGCPTDEPTGCLADTYGRTKDAAKVQEWKWCCDAGC